MLVPTFVVDRAQRMLYEFKLLQKQMPDLKMPPIYLDSPMGVKTTEIYSKYKPLLSRGLKEMLLAGEDPFEPEGFKFVRTADESRAINDVNDAIVLAGSGMCAGGRIMHHLKHSLYKKDTHVFFVGYQAYGTLGRRLVDGAKTVRIAGEEVAVNASFHTLNGFSAHADQDDLLKWASFFPQKTQFIVVHGEPKSSQALAECLSAEGYFARVPAFGDEIDLTAKAPEKAGRPVIAQSIRDRAEIYPLDVENALNSIASCMEDMRESVIKNSRQYKETMPLLISARVLLEAAAALSEGRLAYKLKKSDK
jgi:metallo-beta-lactamase family protein